MPPKDVRRRDDAEEPRAADRRVKAPPLPPKTTEQEDLTTSGQRRVNLIWEVTQSAIAISVTFTAMTTAMLLIIRGIAQGDYPQVISNAFFVIIGFYFGRTNHTKVGGTGYKKPGEER